VNEVNSDPRRGSGPTSSWTRIELDEQADRLITERGYTRTSIPPDGEILYLRRNANTSDGGTAVDVTDEVHPDNRDIAVRAARAIGLDIAGVDFLTTDISSSMWKNGGRICEINSRPGLRKHLWPAKGRPRDVITPIIDMLIPAGQPSRIPVVAVTGSGSTGVVARMLAHILTAAGHHVGLAADRRVYSGGRRIGRGRLSPPKAARAIFLDPDVDAAVLEMAPDDVVQHGLGCDTFNVVVVINAHEASATDDQRAALRVVARAARDVVYVGHSDDGAAAIESACGSAALCRVLADPARGPAPAGGRRAVIEGGSIAIYDGLRSLVQIPRADLLKGQAGAGGAGNAEAALYASVAAFSLGQDPKDIFRSLGTFDPTPPSRKGAGRRQRARTRKKPDDELQASGLSTKTVQSSAVPVADASGTAAAGAGKRAANGRFTTRPVAKS
jgi:cyanophycin synthetase